MNEGDLLERRLPRETEGYSQGFEVVWPAEKELSSVVIIPELYSEEEWRNEEQRIVMQPSETAAKENGEEAFFGRSLWVQAIEPVSVAIYSDEGEPIGWFARLSNGVDKMGRKIHRGIVFPTREDMTANREPPLAIVERYKKEPLAFARDFIRVQRLVWKTMEGPERFKEDVIRENIRAYVDMVAALDRKAFPAYKKDENGEEIPQHGFIPKYLPHNFSDMGKDPNVETEARLNEKGKGREKIRVDKRQMGRKFTDLLAELIARDAWDEEEVVREISAVVHNRIVYDYFGNMGLDGESIVASDFMDREGVCRNISINAAVAYQFVGIESRLVKCFLNPMRFYKGDHGISLVKVKGRWRLSDETRPAVELDWLEKVAPDQVRLGEVSDFGDDLDDVEASLQVGGEFDTYQTRYDWVVNGDRYVLHTNMWHRVRERDLVGEGREEPQAYVYSIKKYGGNEYRRREEAKREKRQRQEQPGAGEASESPEEGVDRKWWRWRKRE